MSVYLVEFEMVIGGFIDIFWDVCGFVINVVDDFLGDFVWEVIVEELKGIFWYVVDFVNIYS